MKAMFTGFLLAPALALFSCGGATERNTVATNGAVPVQSSPPSQPSPSPTPEETNILFILDSSGSMKAKVQGRTKMEIAKEVVNDLAAGLAKNINAGLLAYGHRHKDDCRDTELIIPVGPVDAGVFSQKVNGLQPVGQTPISYSITEAAAVLKEKKGKKTIILVSDGEETCKQDPCAVAAELKKADVDLKVHVVGFGIDKATAKRQLNCIAEATGGVYKDAGDAAQLKETLEGLTKTEEASAGDKGRLIVDHLDSYGKRVFWCVEVYPEGQTGIPNRVFEGCSNDKATENAFDIRPGRYDIWAYGANVKSKPGKQTVEIVAGRDMRMPLEQSGRVFLNILDETGAPAPYVAQAKDTGDIRGGATFYSGEWHELLPGTYEISVWGGPARLDNPKGVVIRSGQETKLDIRITR